MSTTEERTAWVDGLRQLADFIEATPEFTLPSCAATIYLWGDRGTDPKGELARLVRLLGAGTKTADDMWIGVERRFGPIKLDVRARRKTVCERVLVGTTTEKRYRAPEGIELLEVDETVDVYEWVCPPSLLGLAGEVA